jgi:hypothetical protein
MKPSRSFCVASLLTLLGGVGLAQSTWWVDAGATSPGNGTPESPYASIHYAVHQPNVASGDLVLVLPGRYRETVEIVDKYVTLRSTAGAATTVIDAEGQGTVVTVVATPGSSARPNAVVIEGFTITGGTGTWRNDRLTGGGLLVENVELWLQRSIVRANRATLGAGIAVSSALLDLYDVELEDNQAETAHALKDGKGGALHIAGPSFVQTDAVRMRENVAGLGGAVYAEGGEIEMVDTQILGNLAWGETYDGLPAQGGGVFAVDTVLSIASGRIGENLAWGPNTLGGGLRVCGESRALVERTLFDQNAAGDWPHLDDHGWASFGGGIASDAEFTAHDIQVRGNHAAYGGGFYGAGALYRPLVVANTARHGGGVYTFSEALHEESGCYVEGAEILENRAYAIGGEYGEGGGIWGPAVAVRSTLAGNIAYGHGGGAYGATLIQAYVFQNRILPVGAYGPYYGAGVYGGRVEESILEENAAVGFGDVRAYGGGAANASLVLTQVCGNQAPHAAGAADSEIDRCTIYGNLASHGCGGVYFGSRGHVTSSILWNNSHEQIVDDFGTTVEFSIVQDGWRGNVKVDPMFWYPEACDFNLLPGSYAIDHGDPSMQDPDGSPCDMGAWVYDAGHCGTPQTYCQAEADSQGCLPRIGFEGTPSLTGADDFAITADGMIDETVGLLVWGYDVGRRPFSGSVLCIAGPLVRTPVQNTGGSGAAARDCSGTMGFHLSHEYMEDHGLGYGRPIFAQYLYRDAGGGFGRTEGLRVVICP